GSRSSGSPYTWRPRRSASRVGGKCRRSQGHRFRSGRIGIFCRLPGKRPLSSAQQVGPAAWLDFKQRSPAHLLEPDARCGAYRPSGISAGRACRAAGHAATGLAAGYLSGGRFERSYLLAPAESNGRAHAQHRHRLYLSDTLRFPAVASASSTRAPFLELAPGSLLVLLATALLMGRETAP